MLLLLHGLEHAELAHHVLHLLHLLHELGHVNARWSPKGLLEGCGWLDRWLPVWVAVEMTVVALGLAHRLLGVLRVGPGSGVVFVEFGVGVVEVLVCLSQDLLWSS